MSLAQQIVYSLDGIEGRGRHFDKDSVPVAHRAVPEARKLECAQVAAAERLLRDKSRGRVDVFAQIITGAVAVFEIAHKVYRIEITGAFHHLHIFGLRHIDLC